MNKKMIFFIELVLVILLILLGIYLLNNKLNFDEEDSYEEEVKTCELNSDCSDNNDCTIDLCDSNLCSNVNITLCYQNDGCCPSGCNINTDNDCKK